MLRTFIAFLILLAAVCLGTQIRQDSGYILIALNHWTIETTVWTAIFGLLFLFLFSHILLNLLHYIAAAPAAIRAWHAKQLTQKAQAITNQGLIEYSEGYWLQAKKHLIQALPHSEAPLLNYLTAARAAQKMGNHALRDHYLRQAQQSMPEATIAVELTQAQLQLANKQWEQALATLRHLQDLAPQHPYVLKCLIHLYQEVKDWPQLLALLPILKKHKIIGSTELATLEQNTYLQTLRNLAKQHQNQALTDFFHSRPKSLLHNAVLAEEYALFLLKNKDYAQAESLLAQSLRSHYTEQLVKLYGLLPGNEQTLSFAESLLKKHNSWTLYLCLGRLCRHLHLWGKAKHYLEQSLLLSPQPETYLALGQLHEEHHESELACEQYKKGLRVSLENED